MPRWFARLSIVWARARSLWRNRVVLTTSTARFSGCLHAHESVKFPPSTTTVSIRWTQAHQPLHQRDPAVLVLHVGGGDRHGKQAAAAVHRDMSFAAQHFLAGVISPLALRRVAFDRLLIDDGHCRNTAFAPRFCTLRHHQTNGQSPPATAINSKARIKSQQQVYRR